VQIFKDLFGTPISSTDPNAAAALSRKKSILDFVMGKYTSMIPRLGTTDRMTMQQHLDKIRELEMGLTATSVGASTCAVPMKVDTTGYNPGTALCGTMCSGADTGAILDVKTDSMIPVTAPHKARRPHARPPWNVLVSTDNDQPQANR
jgi:hypothetical protein